VLNLHRAAIENRKDQIKANVLGLSVAVSNALDAFLGGKGKMLENWLAAMGDTRDDQATQEDRKNFTISPVTRAFFSGAPVVTQKE
jgi:hypothetical protein